MIQASYGANLNQIEFYFLALQNEAKSIQENADAKIVVEMPANPEQGRIIFQDIPQNPLAELGLSRKKTTDSPNEYGTALGKQRINIMLPSSQKNTPAKNGILLNYRTEERDRYFDIRKNHIIGFHPEMENLDFDPFPDAKSDDIVQKALIGRELVLFAKLKAPVDAINLGIALELNGHKFGLNEVNLQFEANGELAIFDVEGSEWLSYVEPMKLIAKIRKELAKKSV